MYPERSQFVEVVKLRGQAAWFTPIDYVVLTRRNVSEMNIIGVDERGARILVRTNMPLYVFMDYCAPEKLEHLKYEYVDALPGMCYSEQPRKYVKVYFTDLWERKRFIKANAVYNDVEAEYLYWAHVRINTCGWNKVVKYKVLNEENEYKLPNQIWCEWSDIIPQDTPEHLLKEKSIICAWDLETYTRYPFGRIPSPTDTSDEIRLCAMVFRWIWSKDNLLKVVIHNIKGYTYTSENLTVIYSANIPETMAKVLSAMQPDYITGFNDGNYDWPFIKNRIDDETFLKYASALRLRKNELKQFGSMKLGKNQYPRAPMIKIEKGTNMFFNGMWIPGIVAFDTAIALRRVNKNEVKWSLNFFLSKYDLPEKKDMAYDLMARIFRLWELVPPASNTRDDEIVYPNDPICGKNAVRNLTYAEIMQHLAQTDKVIDYCVYDAESVLDILVSINLIFDIKGMGTLSCTSLRDGFYRANGVKIRNCVLSWSMQPRWGTLEEKYPLVFRLKMPYKEEEKEKRKYPGGLVILDSRGFYGYTAEEKLRLGIGDHTAKVFSDRPCVGLDFNSLYPSLIMAFNLSSEMYSPTKPVNEVTYTKCSTYYKFSSEEKSPKDKYVGWFYKPSCTFDQKKWTYKNQGIFPTILMTLMTLRKSIKAEMEIWKSIVELLTRDVGKPSSLEEISILVAQKIHLIQKTAESLEGKKRELELSKISHYKFALKNVEDKWPDSTECQYKELLKEAQFKAGYFDKKQINYKEFMNSFYGEMGNENSPFFIVAMSGGVTKNGRRGLKTVRRFVETLGYRVHYGDTDSLYISPPDSVFADCDVRFETGVNTRVQYFEEMVGITMNQIRELSGIVNEYLEEKLGNPFLKMAYEEVLFPYGFFGRKTYFGMQHMNSIDFTLPTIVGSYYDTAGKKKFLKDLFIRGLPFRRRDCLPFINDNLADMFIDFCVKVRPFDSICDERIKQLIDETTKNPGKYIDQLKKNYNFREPKANSRTALMRFRQRMIKLQIEQKINNLRNNPIELQREFGIRWVGRWCFENMKYLCRTVFGTDSEVEDFRALLEGPYDEDLAQLRVEVPQYGERHDLILTYKPDVANKNGTKCKLKKGDCLEFVSTIGDPHYAAYIRRTYARAGITVEFESVRPDYEHYYGQLFAKVGRLSLYKYTTDILAEERRCGDIKEAERKVVAKIRKSICESYRYYFPKIKIDSSHIRQAFATRMSRWTGQVCTGVILRIYKKYIGTNYEVKNCISDMEKALKPSGFRTFKVNLPKGYKPNLTQRREAEELRQGLHRDMQDLCRCTNPEELRPELINSMQARFNRLRAILHFESEVALALSPRKTVVVQDRRDTPNEFDMAFAKFLEQHHK